MSALPSATAQRLAREIADVTIGADDLQEVVTLQKLSQQALMKRIHWNYRTIVGFNAGLIALGVLGILHAGNLRACCTIRPHWSSA